MSDPAPVSAAERVEALDVLRGVALFGVFLMNFEGFAGANLMATESQLLALPSAGFDFALGSVFDWLVRDKANTVFAFLFGLGFYLQMTRLEARGADAQSLYRRRLTVLLIIGVLHLVFFWNWDILHLYALAGFFLLAFRRMSDRALVVVGLLLAIFGRTAVKTMLEFSAGSGGTDWYSDAMVLERQTLSSAGDYWSLVRHFKDEMIGDYLLSGMLVGWLAYALGRFFIGAWVGRRGFVEHSVRFLPLWRRVRSVALPAGLVLEGVAVLLADVDRGTDFAHRELLAWATHLVAVPVLAAGYVAAIVTGLHGRASRVLGWFAPVGRMALTNYLTQSLVFGFVLFGVGPGLGLAGRIGATAIAGIVVVFFSAQVIVSRWWLGRYAYGPAEWVWRAFTYGERPSMRSGS
ncbi:MAG: DUF418 domain-containing protein [Pseudomonadota bacterium]